MNNDEMVGLKNTHSKKRVNIAVLCEQGVCPLKQNKPLEQKNGCFTSFSMTFLSLRTLREINHVYQINHTNHSSDNKIYTKSEIQKIIANRRKLKQIIVNPGKKFHFKHEGVSRSDGAFSSSSLSICKGVGERLIRIQKTKLLRNEDSGNVSICQYLSVFVSNCNRDSSLPLALRERLG